MTDIEIAQQTKTKNIKKIAKKLGLKNKDLFFYGENVAKIFPAKRKRKAKLILVTSINPTRAGEGKTTVSIGLADALNHLKKKTCLALREPSLGPVFGIKGGATGGGQSQIVPMAEINLHFTGDFDAITSANNLLCSLIDNHIYFGNQLQIDPEKILFSRCLDLNDRALRDVEIKGKFPRKETFNITAASEIMAIMCVSKDIEDLKKRLGNILVALTYQNKPIFARDLQAVDSMAILLKDALKPNLVQTLKGTPAIVHCGPFANIAHGCNSVIATETAMGLADYVVTEAGFGADLGAEKFLDFKCRLMDTKPNCVVIVVTIKALKLHGGVEYCDLEEENLEAIKVGVKNLNKHIDSIKNVFKLPFIVTLNKYKSDTKAEISLLKSLLSEDIIVNEVWEKGALGGIALAKKVLQKCEENSDDFSFSYNLNDSIETKINDIVRKIYGGKKAIFSQKAKDKIKLIKKLGFADFPIIIAKTQYSLSADETLLGRPQNFEVEVQDVQVRSGAGFLVVVCGKILLMPGLSKEPAAIKMKIDKEENISGLF